MKKEQAKVKTGGVRRLPLFVGEKDGKTFRWDTPPDDTGHPGEDYGCRCTAEPKLDDLLTALEKE